jgi:hypothetical protein
MGTPVPFQPKPDRKGNKQPWSAILPGKGLTTIAPPDATAEEAQSKLAALLASTPAPSTQQTMKVNSEKSPSSDAPNVSSKPADKPKTADVITDGSGLTKLSPEKLKFIRERIGIALAGGNVTLDRFLVSFFRDEVPHIDPSSLDLLALGYELLCEQYFKNGVIPPVFLIALGNVQLMGALVSMSKPKAEKEPPKGDASIAAAAGPTSKNKQK